MARGAFLSIDATPPQEGCVDDAGEGPVLVRSDCLTMMKVGCINDPFLIRSEDDQISVPAD